jgi:hypothetical protein
LNFIGIKGRIHISSALNFLNNVKKSEYFENFSVATYLTLTYRSAKTWTAVELLGQVMNVANKRTSSKKVALLINRDNLFIVEETILAVVKLICSFLLLSTIL